MHFWVMKISGLVEQNMDGLVARDADLLAEAVYRSCAHKARIVANDEKEQGERAF
jgi:3-dehydroquinate synthase